MSYSIDELYKFKETQGGYSVGKYLKRDDPNVTEVEIPAEYNGLPVVEIMDDAFYKCKFLREVYFPDSVTMIKGWAFDDCPELRKIRLPKHITIESVAFNDCPKLAPEIVMAGLVGSAEDFSKPFYDEEYLDWNAILRPDVFSLAVKYDSFKKIGTEMLFRQIVWRRSFAHFDMLEKAGKSPNAEETDALIEFSSENGYTEMTAYLLDYKNRKFGFNGGDKFEL